MPTLSSASCLQFAAIVLVGTLICKIDCHSGARIGWLPAGAGSRPSERSSVDEENSDSDYTNYQQFLGPDRNYGDDNEEGSSRFDTTAIQNAAKAIGGELAKTGAGIIGGVATQQINQAINRAQSNSGGGSAASPSAPKATDTREDEKGSQTIDKSGAHPIDLSAFADIDIAPEINLKMGSRSSRFGGADDDDMSHSDNDDGYSDLAAMQYGPDGPDGDSRSLVGSIVGGGLGLIPFVGPIVGPLVGAGIDYIAGGSPAAPTQMPAPEQELRKKVTKPTSGPTTTKKPAGRLKIHPKIDVDFGGRSGFRADFELDPEEEEVTHHRNGGEDDARHHRRHEDDTGDDHDDHADDDDDSTLGRRGNW